MTLKISMNQIAGIFHPVKAKRPKFVTKRHPKVAWIAVIRAELTPGWKMESVNCCANDDICNSGCRG